MAKRRSRGRPPAAPMDVAVGWYDAAQWAKLKQVAVDADQLDDSHEQWRRNAENLERGLRHKGIEIRRVPIDVDSLVAWCRARNRALDGEARSQYAAELAASSASS
jgi:hypothetical protein